MTEQPKFQRRKRRGAASAIEQPQHVTAEQADPTIEELEALIAEKEALLQRKAEAEAKRRREAEIEAERARAAKEAEEQARTAKAARDAELEAKRQARKAELEAQRKRDAESAEQIENSRRAKREAPLVLASPPTPKANPTPLFDPEASWKSIDRFQLDPQRLAERNVITALRHDPSHTRFDILRTRMLQALSENGWKRVAITSPTKDCGKTFTAANLAISLSRQENCRTVLLDLDMRSPSLHKIFGVSDTGAIGDMLRGDISPEDHLQGFAPNTISAGSHVAVGFNGIVEPYAAELLQDPSTQAAFENIEKQFKPTVMLFDLPPALLNDDVIAMRPHIDALLIVAAGGTTKANDIKETERRLGEKIPLLGVILNKAEHAEAGDYPY
ncbi:MAG: exopolysaccharide biosynthesis protein [Rhodobacteraceae bacterium]|nr:exopolysaccharide biosynthesis protein [Paracoccaceae bacterium]